MNKDTFIDMMNAMMKHKHIQKSSKTAKEIEQYMSKKYKKK